MKCNDTSAKVLILLKREVIKSHKSLVYKKIPLYIKNTGAHKIFSGKL